MRNIRSFIPKMPGRDFSERAIISDAELELLTHPPRNLTERGILAGSALVAENTRQGRNLDDSLFAKAVAKKFGVDEVDVLTATGRIVQTRDDLKKAHPELSALTISALTIENLRSEAVSDDLDFTAKTAPKIDLDFMAETRKDLDFTATTATPTRGVAPATAADLAARQVAPCPTASHDVVNSWDINGPAGPGH